MVSDFNYWSKVAKRFFSLALTFLLLYLVLRISIFYLPFLISFILALLLEPIIRFCMKKLKWTRQVSSIFVMVVITIVILGILTWGITTLFNEANHLLDGAEEYFNKIKSLIDMLTKNDYLNNKIPDELKNIIENSESEYLKSISNILIDFLNGIKQWIGKLPNLLMTFFFSIGALYFMCTDKIYMIDQIEHHLPDNWSRKLTIYIQKIAEKTGKYLKAEIILVFISFFISFLGLWILKIFGLNIQYPLISSLLIGIVDALPILGSGTAMIPWAIISALDGDYILGICITVLWLIMTMSRNMIEPHIVSKNIGIHPVFTLLSMFTGYKIIGLTGIIVGPILLIILKELYSPLFDKGIVRSLLERSG